MCCLFNLVGVLVAGFRDGEVEWKIMPAHIYAVDDVQFLPSRVGSGLRHGFAGSRR